MQGSHSSVAQNSSLLGRYTLSLGKTVTNPKDKGTMILCKARKYITTQHYIP